MGRCTESAIRLEEIHRKSGVGVKTVQLEPAGRCLSVIVTSPGAQCRRTRLQDCPTDDPDIMDELLVGSDDAAEHGHATAKSDGDFQVRSSRPRFARNEVVGIHARPARLAGGEFATTEFAEDIFFVGSKYNEVTGTWCHGKRERSIVCRHRLSETAGGISARGGRI